MSNIIWLGGDGNRIIQYVHDEHGLETNIFGR